MKLRFITGFFIIYTFCTLQLSAQVSLIEPKNYIVTLNPSIQFSWNTTSYSTRYTLEISTSEDFSTIISTLYSNNNKLTFLLPTSSVNTNYYWRVRANNMIEWSEVYKISLISLNNFGNLSGWFMADSSVTKDVSNNVDKWSDLSGNSNNATQSNLAEKPTYMVQEAAINNKPAIKFTSDLSQIKTLVFSNPMLLNDFTILLVRNHEPSNFAAQYVVAGIDNGIISEINALSAGYGHYRFTQYRFTNVASLDQQFSIYTHENDVIRKNGALSTLAYNSITPSLSLERIGTRTDFSTAAYKGKLAELIIYNVKLPIDSVEILEQYLRYKYAPSVNLGADTLLGSSFCDTLRLHAGNRFNSYLWSNGETTESILVTANNTYTVKVKDIFGFESTDDIVVLPYKKLGNRTVNICRGDTLKLDLKTPSGIIALWNTGATTTKINITQEGQYTVILTDTRGCSVKDTINVKIDNPRLSIAPVSNNINACSGEKLFVQTETSFDSIRWSTGSTANFIQLNTSGTYSINATTSAGCTLNRSFNVNIVGSAPTARFNYGITCEGLAVNFSDSTLVPVGNNIQSWKWTFSNGDTSSLKNPSKIFQTLGLASAALKVTTTAGCSDSIFRSFVINKKPIPSFYNLLSCSGIPTTFVDQSIPNSAAVTDWSWDFGGLGISNSIQNPSFRFPSAGIYNVRLKATNSNGCFDTITIQTSVNVSPVSNFSYDSVCGKTPVNLKFLATVEPPSTIPDLNWGNWDFGDGTIETAIRNPQHVYAGPGTYEVRLIVKSSGQCIDTAIKQVKVFDFPTVDFSVSQTQCTGKEIQFTDISFTPDGTPLTKWNWFFSGLGSDTIKNPRYTFNTQGNYTIQLTARNSVGCVGTKLRSIAVSAPPVPKFTFSPNGLPAPLNVNYTNQSPLSGNYIWDYGDGSPLIQAYNPPQHQYTVNGSYPIKLIATDFRGCTDTLTKYILVDKAYLDGVMASITITPNGDYYKIQANVFNNSNIEITALGLSLQLGGGAVIRENWTGSLLPGQSVVYAFVGEIKIGESGQLPIVCATIDNINNNTREDRTDNNTTCKEVKVGSFDILNIYPNPAYDNINFGVMLPKDGRVNIRFIDIVGQQMYNKDFDGIKGYNAFAMPTAMLNAAVYVAEVSYDGEVIRKKFMRKDRK